jgi:competence protein ComEA
MIKLDKKNIIIIVLIISVIGIAYYLYSNDFSVFNQDSEASLENEDKVNFESNNTKDENNNNIVVHISGAVLNEGVIELKEGSRITDAIEKAGGLKENACIKDINLAEVLDDGIKINIPTIDEYNKSKENIVEEKTNNAVQPDNKTISQKNNIKVNINTATQTELETLPGIGSSTALKIINYRKENGKFKSIEDIKKVSRNRRK